MKGELEFQEEASGASEADGTDRAARWEVDPVRAVAEPDEGKGIPDDSDAPPPIARILEA